MIPWTNELVTTLQPDEVFVFGSNATGFHGAGAAGLACRGDARNTWRQDAWFQAALRTPPGSPERVGKWAILGQARGWQQGSEGMSYAVQTIERPGQRRSTSRRFIYAQLLDLWRHIADHPEWTYLLTPLGEGYSGYSHAEMQQVWEYLLQVAGERRNIRWTGYSHGVTTT